MVNKKVNALGFDRFQIASIRRAYQNNAQVYKKMDTISNKVKELADKYNALEAETLAWEAPAKQLSKDVLGIELTSREILYFSEHPEEFFEKHPEVRDAAPTEEAPVEAQPEAPAEESAEAPEPAEPIADPFN